jgi:hypothetical protein
MDWIAEAIHSSATFGASCSREAMISSTVFLEKHLLMISSLQSYDGSSRYGLGNKS